MDGIYKPARHIFPVALAFSVNVSYSCMALCKIFIFRSRNCVSVALDGIVTGGIRGRAIPFSHGIEAEREERNVF